MVPSRFLRAFRQPIGRPPVRLLAQQRHVQIAPRAPLALGHVLEPGGHEQERGPLVGEGADHAGVPAYLPVQALDGVVCAYAPPVLEREARVCV